jgi:hypothetical protein
VTTPPEVWLPCALALASGLVAAIWMIRVSRPGAIATEPSPELLEAMIEVDALTPGSAPIAPSPRAVERRAIEARKKAMRRDPNWLPPGGRPPPPPAPPAKVWPSSRLDLSRLVPPDAVAAGVWPRCRGAGGYHHRSGIPCGHALNERRPPPPQPMPTRAPGPGTLAQS